LKIDRWEIDGEKQALQKKTITTYKKTKLKNNGRQQFEFN
jgi:hypothetical protein